MNSRVFEILPVLNTVSLRGNKCINKSYEGSADMLILPKEVTEGCVFTETDGLKFKKLLGIDCGNIFLRDDLIYGGNRTKHGRWPFLAGILKKEKTEFFCGGSLITSQHVLTAAHCVESKKKARKKPADIVVFLGRHSLSSTLETDSVTENVKDILVHPDWKTENKKYDADFAILVLEQAVEFSHFIQPVCLTDDFAIAEYEDGFVVGWGQSSVAQQEDVPNQILIRSLTDTNCLQDEWELGRIFSNRSFCAGGRGSVPCKGDSGE